MRMIFLLSLVTLTACASLSGSRDHTFVCLYDTVWDATSATMRGYSVTSENKTNGTIETAWVEMEGQPRPYGLFGREGFGNRERARLSVVVTNDDNRSSVNVLETRERWHAKGGVKQLATKWWPVEPSEEVMDDITKKLTARLKEKGCEAHP
mgnify:FL=1